MDYHFAGQAAKTPAAVVAAPIAIDAVDLMFELGQLRTPDTFVDQIIEVLIARGDFRRRIHGSEIRFNSWLAGSVRPYTAGGPALQVLAHRLGYRLTVTKTGNRFAAVAYDVNTRQSSGTVTGHIEGAAGILALLRMAYGDRNA
jgi:hypothetical protein